MRTAGGSRDRVRKRVPPVFSDAAADTSDAPELEAAPLRGAASFASVSTFEQATQSSLRCCISEDGTRRPFTVIGATEAALG